MTQIRFYDGKTCPKQDYLSGRAAAELFVKQMAAEGVEVHLSQGNNMILADYYDAETDCDDAA